MCWDKYEQDLFCKISENDGYAELFHTVCAKAILRYKHGNKKKEMLSELDAIDLFAMS
jgi:hypothetical protein